MIKEEEEEEEGLNILRKKLCMQIKQIKMVRIT